MSFLSTFKKYCSNFGINIGRDNYGDITIVNNPDTSEDLGEIKNSLSVIKETIQTQPNFSAFSEIQVRDAVDTAVNAEIDNLTSLINENRPKTALGLLNNLYERVASNSQGKIRFRILANIGVCHYLLGDQIKAANFFLDAFIHAPDEPKAIANKTLALIFLNRGKDAFNFAKKQIELDPSNIDLAGYLLQAAKSDPNVTDPIKYVPEQLRNTPQVLVGLINYFQHRGSILDWLPIAEQGIKLLPDNEELKFYFALGKVESILIPTENKISHSISETQILELNNACIELHSKWNKHGIEKGAVSQESKVALFTLAETYLFLSEFDKAIDLIKSAIEKDITDDHYYLKLAEFVYSLDTELAKKALSKVTEKSSLTFLEFKIAEIENDLQFIANVPIEVVNSFPANERLCSRALQEIAKLKVNKLGFKEQQFDSIINLAGDDERALLIIARAASVYGNEQISDLAYMKAKSLLSSKSNLSSRLMLANESNARSEWRTTIETLDGYIALIENSHHFRNLALAFANAKPVTNRALEFFRTLPESFQATHAIKLFRGVMYLNLGDMKQAQEFLESAWKLDTSRLDSFMYLANTYNALNDDFSLERLINGVNPFEMKGAEIHKLGLAQLLMKIGKEGDALKLGYEVMSNNLDNPKILQGYLGLMLMKEGETVVPSLTKVQNGFWVKLTNEIGEEFEFLCESENEITHIPIEHSENVLIRNATGLLLGDSFVNERSLGPSHTWTVSEVKHKYIHAMHEIMNTFEKRFSDEPFFSLKMPENDVSSLLDTLKQFSERDDQIFKQYHELHAPLSFIGKRLGNHPSFITAQKLLNAGQEIKTNYGNTQQVEECINQIYKGNISVLVFDAYTIWHAATLELLPILASKFKLVTPASVISEIQLVCENYALQGEDSLGWVNGQAIHYQYTKEQIDESIEVIQNYLDAINEHCVIEYYVWETNPSEIATKILDGIGDHFWDAACISKKPNHLLVSEDLYYREWSSIAVDAKESMWLYPILRYLKLEECISNSVFAKSMIHFANWRHSHIFLDCDLLLDIFNFDDSSDLVKLKSVLHYIGIDNDELMDSHAIVCNKFLNHLWLNISSSEKTKLATDLTLTSLLRFTSQKAFYICMVCIDASDDLNEYVTDWRQGHNISDEDMMGGNSKFYGLSKNLPIN